MNDPTHPLNDDDLSAAIDGEADEAVVARIAADPEATARMTELAAVSERLGAVDGTPLDDHIVDDLIATALDAPMAPAAPARPRTNHRGPAPWAVAAAVIVLMAIGFTLMWAGRSNDSDSASAKFNTVGSSISTEKSASSGAGSDRAAADKTATDAHLSGASNSASDAPSTTAATGTAAPTAGATGPFYLGTYDTADQLRSAIATSFAEAASGKGWVAELGSPAMEAPAPAAIGRCADFLQATLSMKDAPLETGYAQVGGKSVLVYEFAAPSTKDATRQTTLVAAVGPEACEQVIIFER